MAGLILNLKPEEKFLVNGVVLQNGPKRTQLRIETENANILRLSDALHPNEVNTPVKRVYYIAQLILTGDIPQGEGKKQLIVAIDQLQNVFQMTAKEPLEKAMLAAQRDRFYSVLYSLKAVLPIETELLQRGQQENPAEAARKVA